MKKIGIISLFDLGNMNYGNRLQTFALNYYLRKNYKDYIFESLFFKSLVDNKDRNLVSFFVSKFPRIPAKINALIAKRCLLSKRLVKCNKFSYENTVLCSSALTGKMLRETNYDVFIVGSDIVWSQYKNGISRIRFLDFETIKGFKRISYAASFGRDWIPNENVSDIVRCLKKFSNISVREASSVQLLKSIGIENVVHTLDPTLLLNSEEWQRVEKKPEIQVEKYIFVYLLGKSDSDRKYIASLAKKMNLTIITVPYACGEFSFSDKNFGDVQIRDCSPEEWIWLIHNAEYVITDSFHGTVFSTIFEKKFLVVERQFVENINNRMIDYLNTIQQNDKMVKISQVKSFDKFIWNYENINKLLKEKIEFSKEFLEDALKNI